MGLGSAVISALGSRPWVAKSRGAGGGESGKRLCLLLLCFMEPGFGGGEEGVAPGLGMVLLPGSDTPPHQLSGDSRDSCAQVGRVIMFHSFHLISIMCF